MSNILSSLYQTLAKYPSKQVVVAYSGGVDSQVLLHALVTLTQQHKINNPLLLCHVNHGLSPNAKDWQQFAVQQGDKYDIPVIIEQVCIDTTASQSLEAAAREARYSALKKAASHDAIIVTGHHSDDQAETFLLALKRGAGLKGLSSMAEEVELDKQLLVRPLLTISRKEIEQYAINYHLTWVEDESNLDTDFDRNFLRHDIMPLLSQRWPSIKATIARSASHCYEGQQLLNELAQADLSNCVTDSDVGALAIEQLKILSQARFNNLMRYYLQLQQRLMPSTEQLSQVYQQIFADVDKSPEIKVGDYCLRRFNQALYITENYQDISSWQKVIAYHEIQNHITIELPDKLGELTFTGDDVIAQPLTAISYVIKAPINEENISIRFSHNNPKCLPEYRQNRRPLKKVLQELKIPVWQRKRIPFLYYGDIFVAAIGHFVCKEYLPDESDKLLNVLWLGQDKSG